MDGTKFVGSLAGAAGRVAALLPSAAGAALISVAGWMVYPPAGLALAGAFCLLADWRTR